MAPHHSFSLIFLISVALGKGGVRLLQSEGQEGSRGNIKKSLKEVRKTYLRDRKGETGTWKEESLETR